MVILTSVMSPPHLTMVDLNPHKINVTFTKLESNTIRAFLLLNTDVNGHYISADHSNISISKDCNRLLEFFMHEYNRTHKTTHGKSAVLHILLRDFIDQEKAIASFEGVDLKSYHKSVMSALQQFKKIARQYVDDDITTANDAIFSILIWSTIREFEIKNDLRITDFRDDQFEDERETRTEPLDGIEDYSQITKKQAKLLLSSVPIVNPIQEPSFIVKPLPQPDPALQPVYKPVAIVTTPAPIQPVKPDPVLVTIPNHQTVQQIQGHQKPKPVIIVKHPPLEPEEDVSPVQEPDSDISDLFEDENNIDVVDSEDEPEPEDIKITESVEPEVERLGRNDNCGEIIVSQ